jgi:hypothetical protein
MHGGALGWLGRRERVPSEQALRDMGMATLYAIPALALGWLVTVWIAMTMVARYLDRALPLVGVAAGWALGLAVVALAAVKGLEAIGNAYARWPEKRAGTLLVAGSFAALLVLFLAERPEIWFLRLRFTEVGAVLLAAFLSVWVAGPLVTLALRMRRGLPRLSPDTGLAHGPRSVVNVGVGLTAGLVLGLLAVPFAAPLAPAWTGSAGTVVHALGAALVDEVLLRLFLITGVAWLLLRWHRVHPEEAAALAVGGVSLVQVLLYLPGILAAGFPTPFAAATFALLVVLLPAVVFGVLYWTRGFGTALVADATTVGALALLAV